MALEVKIAETEAEKHICYNIRYLAYLGMGYVNEKEHPSHELTDEYDQHSIILLASKNQRNVGTIRLTRDSELGFQMESLFDLSELRRNCVNLWESSKIMALPGERYGVTMGLANAVYIFMKQNRITDLCYMAHPTHAKMYEKLGIYPFAETKIHLEVGQPAVPLHWDLKNITPKYKKKFEERGGVIIHL